MDSHDRREPGGDQSCEHTARHGEQDERDDGEGKHRERTSARGG
jgi:hypothetical protein